MARMSEFDSQRTSFRLAVRRIAHFQFWQISLATATVIVSNSMLRVRAKS